MSIDHRTAQSGQGLEIGLRNCVQETLSSLNDDDDDDILSATELGRKSYYSFRWSPSRSVTLDLFSSMCWPDQGNTAVIIPDRAGRRDGYRLLLGVDVRFRWSEVNRAQACAKL